MWNAARPVGHLTVIEKTLAIGNKLKDYVGKAKATRLRKDNNKTILPFVSTVLDFCSKICGTNAICERRIREPLVSWAPVTIEKRDCEGFIQHFGLPVTVWQLTLSTPSPPILEHDTRRSDHGHVFRCEDAGNERFHAKEASDNGKAVCVRFMTFM